ncbi:MAG: flagellar basal body rod protein FlgC [Proteobacteria bacterium]|nr:flagellar basal body rod protein FlgC [Pseudomonadota bacterium]
MVSGINASISGLTASAKRIEVAANNIANQNSTKTLENGEAVDKPFVPQRVDLVTLSNAGVAAKVSDAPNPVVQQPDGEGGLVDSPNVDVARELVDIKLASYDYKANIKAIQVQAKNEESLLNILS